MEQEGIAIANKADMTNAQWVVLTCFAIGRGRMGLGLLGDAALQDAPRGLVQHVDARRASEPAMRRALRHDLPRELHPNRKRIPDQVMKYV